MKAPPSPTLFAQFRQALERQIESARALMEMEAVALGIFTQADHVLKGMDGLLAATKSSIEAHSQYITEMESLWRQLAAIEAGSDEKISAPN